MAQEGVRYSITNLDVYIESNIVGFYNILETCRNYPVDHIAYALSLFFRQLKRLSASIDRKQNITYFILIVGTVVFSVRYLIRSIMGKRQKVHLIDGYKQAKKQVELRNKLVDNKRSKRDHKK